jgi:N-acetylmuramic acid 6-phosphate etherase
MPEKRKFIKTTEKPSIYRHLEEMSVHDLLVNMNNEDKQVPLAVEKALPQIERLVEAIVDCMLAGGRLFYIGAGTSGRLGILDASECPPTYGVEQGLVVGLMAGGDSAIRNAIEHAEDDENQCWKDLLSYNIQNSDVVIGIAASGTTPYVIGGVTNCRDHGIITGCITCNYGSPLATNVDFPVEVNAGPEFVTGSTRMKCGTIQKVVLNMISTAVMIRLGRVEDNRMVNMQLTNNKLVDRGTRMVMEQMNISDFEEAKALLMKYGSVKRAVSGTRDKGLGTRD